MEIENSLNGGLTTLYSNLSQSEKIEFNSFLFLFNHIVNDNQSRLVYNFEAITQALDTFKMIEPI